MLAEAVGLTTSEFKDWLTIDNETENVELFDGTSVSVQNLSSNDALLASERFSVPNVVYMAWLGDGDALGQSVMKWGQNVIDLGNLGFNVQQFDNDFYDTDNSVGAKTAFLSNMWSFSGNKWLHGAYFMGHGSIKTLGTKNSTLYNNGPTWFVYYRNRDYRDADSSIIAEDTNVTTVKIP